jgi:hypothetical protein
MGVLEDPDRSPEGRGDSWFVVMAFNGSSAESNASRVSP